MLVFCYAKFCVWQGTRNNTKSQYMQVRGSTKVAPGAKADGHFFRDVGLFDGKGVQVEVPAERHSVLFYAATSVVVHDPWSLPFVNTQASATVKQPAIKKRKRDPAPQIDSASFGAITSWAAVPLDDSKWMRGLVERKDGTTRLVSIPSMANPQYWCETIVRLINSGRGVLRVYAKVMNPALCPKTLKAMQQVHCHKSNHSMLSVVEESHPSCKGTSFRMFMRCFSDKCRTIKSSSGYGWVELDKSDFLMARLVHSSAPNI